jgi:lysine-specific demethylase 3
LPDHYNFFHEVLPFATYHAPGGELNLASFLPDTILKPDLGPKMYTAHGMTWDGSGIGSTSLHLDMADAVNIMLYAGGGDEASRVGAIWHIFPQDCLRKLRAYLEGNSKRKLDDQVHDQVRYLDAKMLKEFGEVYGVNVWSVEQCVGDAVYVPAGCAHQVYNLKHCIKVACDFVSGENVGRCLGLMQEFRKLREGHHRKEGIVQIKAMMYWSWKGVM